MQFEWDANKNNLNIEKHGLDFEDAQELFSNRTLWHVEDSRLEYKEVRFIGFGYVKGRLVNIVFTRRDPNIVRMISFRKANQREIKLYEQNFKN